MIFANELSRVGPAQHSVQPPIDWSYNIDLLFVTKRFFGVFFVIQRQNLDLFMSQRVNPLLFYLSWESAS
jgi:hypothetical protein